MDNWDLEIHHINVGQGDSTLMIAKKNNTIEKTVLIDAGITKEGKTVEAYINENIGIKSIDIAVISHHHEDHEGGIYWLQKNSHLLDDAEIISWDDNPKEDFTDLFDLGHSNAPKLIYLGGGFTYLNGYGGDENGNSIVLLIEFGEFLYYTAGDMDRYEIWDFESKMPSDEDDFNNPYFTALGRLICYQKGWTSEKAREQLYQYISAKDGKLWYSPPALPKQIQAFKLSHHGAENDNVNSIEFITSIQPKVGIISVGNRFTTRATPLDYDHPRLETLNRLDNCDSVELYAATNMATSERAYYKDENAMDDDVEESYLLNNFNVPLQKFVLLEENEVPEKIKYRLPIAQDVAKEDKVYKYLYMKEYFSDQNWPYSKIEVANQYMAWLAQDDDVSTSPSVEYKDSKTIILVGQASSLFYLQLTEGITSHQI